MWREHSIAIAEVGNSVSLLGNAVSSLLEWGVTGGGVAVKKCWRGGQRSERTASQALLRTWTVFRKQEETIQSFKAGRSSNLCFRGVPGSNIKTNCSKGMFELTPSGSFVSGVEGQTFMRKFRVALTSIKRIERVEGDIISLTLSKKPREEMEEEKQAGEEEIIHSILNSWSLRSLYISRENRGFVVSNMVPRREVGDKDTVQGVGVGIMGLDEKPRSFTWREKRNTEPGKRRIPFPLLKFTALLPAIQISTQEDKWK